MSLRWEDAAFAFPAAGLDSFLLWAAEQGASDVTFQTGAPAFVEIDGVLRRATGAVLDGVTMGQLCARVFDDTGEGILRSGKAIDCSFAVASGKRRFRRFRCNISPVLADQRFGINLTMRVLPDAPPTFDALGIEPGIVEAWENCRGLTLVTGVPGSGKSTLLAAGTRLLLESGAGRVQSYEAPIEFVFDGIGGDGALMSSSEILGYFVFLATIGLLNAIWLPQLRDAGASDGLGPIGFLAMLTLYVMICYALMNGAFKLIDLLPSAVLEWIGGRAGGGDDGAGRLAGAVTGGIGRAGSGRLTGRLRGGAGSGG